MFGHFYVNYTAHHPSTWTCFYMAFINVLNLIVISYDQLIDQ